MQLDYFVLWALSVANTVVILVLIRYVAQLPVRRRRVGPTLRTAIPEWSATSVDGRLVTSADLPRDYTLLFVSSQCPPCKSLLAELNDSAVWSAAGPLYMVARDAGNLVEQASPGGNPVYDLLLVDQGGHVSDQLEVPGTPFAVSVRDGKVASADVVLKAADLSRVVASGPDRATSAGAP